MPTVEKLKKLLAAGLGPEEVRARIGPAPLVDSFAGHSHVLLELVDLAPVPGLESYHRAFRRGDRAVYWRVGERGPGVEVLGVVWDAAGRPAVFAGIVLPP